MTPLSLKFFELLYNSSISDKMNRIPVYTPYMKKYTKSAIDAIDSNWISNYGQYIKLAATSLSDFLNVKYCILTNSGTAATHCLFKSLKFKYPHVRKIYISNNCFIAPWNCALMEYKEDQLECMKMNNKTLNIETSEEYLLSLEKDSAIVVVHNYGNIINIPRIKRIRPDIVVLEDNCEGLFGEHENSYSGTQSLCSAISFYANKTITTGEGGAFLTNDDEIYYYVKSFITHGMTDKRYIHDKVAVNYAMSNVQAAFLYDQMNDISHILDMKRNVMRIYRKELATYSEEENTNPSNWMFVLLNEKIEYPSFEEYMNKMGVEVRPLFYDIYTHSHTRNIRKENTIDVKGAILPSYPGLSVEQQEHIISCVKDYLK